jgi:DNA-3-methyladenine glycosylase
LLRAGEVVDGLEVAVARRSGASDRDLARGPARLCRVLGIDRDHNGIDVTRRTSAVTARLGTPVDESQIASGPRIGIAHAAERPWRFWIRDDPTVSPYRRHVPRRTRSH